MPILHCTNVRQRLCSMSAVAIIALATCMSSQAAQSGHEVIGDWKFTSVLEGVEITSIDERQAKQLLGQVMAIRKEGVRFGDQQCGAPSFESKRVEPNMYVRREAQISARKLRLPNPVTVVDIGCTQVFIKQPNQAVIFWDGFFFGAARIKYPESARR
ncbi:hypothetical protein [Massilia niastensis]|uniref:hypothetical protein n=1 Tax=Massilia niastensis TaxID=544911 RepID=UPI0012EC139F|nr:hypothetical protein [Massilia niastensis]